MYVYFYSLYVSGSHVPIIRRIIVSMRHLRRLVCRSICSCIPDGHLHRVTLTRCRIDTIILLMMGTWLPENMQRIEINIHEKLCINLVIYKDHTRMHSQQNTKSWSYNRRGEVSHLSVHTWFTLMTDKMYMEETQGYKIISPPHTCCSTSCLQLSPLSGRQFCLTENIATTDGKPQASNAVFIGSS